MRGAQGGVSVWVCVWGVWRAVVGGEIWKQMAPEFLWLWPRERKFCLLEVEGGTWIYVHSGLLWLFFWCFLIWGLIGCWPVDVYQDVAQNLRRRSHWYSTEAAQRLSQKVQMKSSKSVPRKSHFHYYYSGKSLSNYMLVCPMYSSSSYSRTGSERPLVQALAEVKRLIAYQLCLLCMEKCQTETLRKRKRQQIKIVIKNYFLRKLKTF